MIKEAENIILNKEYFELSEEELATVSELVQNAEEYEEMKWFLASTQQALVSDKIEATPELKKRVMEHLEQPKDNRKFWLNGVVVFLFPEDKKFYQKPAFQMSLAALLIIGFLLVYDRPLQENNMAINDSEQILPTLEEEDEREVISSGESEAGENEFTTTIIEDSKLTDEDLEETDKEVVLEQPVMFMDADAEPIQDVVSEIDELEELPQDGFYQGPVEEEFASDDQSELDNNRSNNKGDGAGTTMAPSVSNNSNNNATTGGALGGNKPSGTSDKTVLQKDERDRKSEGNKKIKSKTSNNKDRFLAKRNETRTVVSTSEDAKNDDVDAVNAEEYKPESGLSLEDSEKKGEFKEQQQEKIRSYELHVNETKELKSLFGTFK